MGPEEKGSAGTQAFSARGPPRTFGMERTKELASIKGNSTGAEEEIMLILMC